METTIRFRVKKDLTIKEEKYILQLKGTLIAKGYTDIIHIGDDGREFHINHFTIVMESKSDANDFITAYSEEKGLTQCLWIL